MQTHRLVSGIKRLSGKNGNKSTDYKKDVSGSLTTPTSRGMLLPVGKPYD